MKILSFLTAKFLYIIDLTTWKESSRVDSQHAAKSQVARNPHEL